MKYEVWSCKIVVPGDSVIPSGFDNPPRSAAIDAVKKSGITVLGCFSGWGGNLTPIEEETVDYIAERNEPSDGD